MTPHEHVAGAIGAIRTIAEEYWETFLDAEPLFASLLGDHRFDLRVADRRAEADRDVREQWAYLRERAAAVAEDSLDETGRDTRDLLIAELDSAIRWIDMRLVELTWDQMQGPHAELLSAASRLQAPEPEDAFHALLRVDSMVKMLGDSIERFRQGVAAGRTPARINITRTCHQIDSYLATPLSSDPFASLPGPEGWRHTGQWQEDLAEAVRDKLRPAYATYREALSRELEPVARSDEQPGLVHLPDGEEIYQALIQHHTGLSLLADDLHEIGLEEATGTIRAEIAEVGARAFGTSDVPEIFDRLRNDPSLRYQSANEILEHARACVQKASEVMGEWFGTVPQSPCVVIPVPDYLAADEAPAYYAPPAADGSRPGEYYVNLHEPTERARFRTAFVSYHEAVPGHHLQLAIAAERTDLPDFRRFGLMHNVFIEGWGLYSERLADEMGLYEDDLDRLGMLAADAWRAGRLVVDTGLHARGWTRQQAIDFMVKNVPLDVETLIVEVDRYIGMPGQALSYMVGQREILEQRDQARAALGDRFDIKGFHDVVLGGATINLPVLRRRVARWIAAESADG